MQHNFASYKSGSFSIDISNLSIDPVSEFIVNEDRPAFIHEYCHYIQDITTISSIFGFSLWMRDVVTLTQVFAKEKDVRIKFPLETEKYEQPLNKYRKLYNIYCGDGSEVYDLDLNAAEIKNVTTEPTPVPIEGWKVTIAVNHIELEYPSKRIHFGLIPLQEIQAYYAQLLAEEQYAGCDFTIKADSLPGFPYKFGDFLFRSYDISIDLKTKFVLVDLCLDTIQAPTVFLKVLEALKGQTVTFFGSNPTDLAAIVDEVNTELSHSNQDAFDQIIPDLKSWASDPNRQYLSNALKWYIKTIEQVRCIKENVSRTFLSIPFTMDEKNLVLLYSTFPPPVLFNKGVFFRNMSHDNEQDKRFEKDFKAASTIWSHRILYDLLCSQNIENLTKHAACPLFEKCDIRPQIDEDYTCKTAPWEIIKNSKKIMCQYGMAAHSFGLWQNTLEIDL